MKKFTREKATGKLGVAFVARVIFEEGSIFRETSGETDLGIDGYIEFVENEVALGILVGVQIKTGASYLVQHGDTKRFEVIVSHKDLKYWNAQPIPTALIVYDPETGLSGWLDVTGYIRSNPDSLNHAYTTLTIDSRAKPFSVNTFQTEFRATFQNYRLEADLFKLADLMASPDPGDKFRGFLGLLSCDTSRYSKLTCFLLLEHLFFPDNRLRAAVSDALSRYLSHPEVGFVPPKEIRDYVESRLKEFGRDEVKKLLETSWLDDENLMERGSLGQSVGVIIIAIPDYARHLEELVIDNAQSYEVRMAAMALASEFGIYDVVKFIAGNLDRVEWGDAREAAQLLAEEFVHIEVAENDLSVVIERDGYDSIRIADILRDASVYFLAENEAIISEILTRAVDPVVRFEASRALNRVIEWRHSLQKHMKKLL